MHGTTRIIIGVGVAMLIVLAAVFRQPIFRLFSSGPGLDILSSQKETSSSPQSAGTSTSPEKGGAKEPTGGNISYASLIPYQGRDPLEVMPDQKSMQNMSETQRAQFSADIKTYGEALKKNPDDLNAWLHLGLLKKGIGDYAGARDAWEYAVRINPLHHVALRNLGELYWRYLPDFTRAEADFREAIKVQPKDHLNFIFLADFYRYGYREKSDLADDVLQDGIKANPLDGDLYRALADLYESTGEYQKARDAWKQILTIEPNNPNAQGMIDELSKKARE